MKFNFFKSKSRNKKEADTLSDNLDELDELGFTKRELMEYDKNIEFYYTNLINSLILFTYNSEELEKMQPILIDPLTELYEELDYAFIPICFETVFRNKKINIEHKENLLNFKKEVEKIPNEIWDYEFIDKHEKWQDVKKTAENILNSIGIQHRIFNVKHHKIMDKNGNVIYQGPDANEK